MISILIPVFNYNVTELVTTLHGQLMSTAPSGEILLFDDASDVPFRKQYRTLANEQVKIHEAIQNVGRSAARNILMKNAKHEHLIFMDCDSSIPHPGFVDHYFQQIKNGYQVVCGGRTYPEHKPERPYYFHWLYGVHKESKPAEMRKKVPHKSFMTNNFLIKKDIFTEINFDESITTYGHEDTLFGYELYKNGYSIKHIDNPVVHEGLERSEVFLEKSVVALKNLHEIADKIDDPDFLKTIKVFHVSTLLKKFKISSIYNLLFNLFRHYMKRNLLGKKPYLFVFDLYKLGVLNMMQINK